MEQNVYQSKPEVLQADLCEILYRYLRLIMKFVVYKYNCPPDWREICRVDGGNTGLNTTWNCEGFGASAHGVEQKIASSIQNIMCTENTSAQPHLTGC